MALWYFTKKKKSQCNETPWIFLGWRDTVYCLKSNFYAYDYKYFSCLTIQSNNLPRQAMEIKATNLKNHHISSLKHLLVQPNAFQLGKILSAVFIYLDFKKYKELLPIWCGNSLIDINHFFFCTSHINDNHF